MKIKILTISLLLFCSGCVHQIKRSDQGLYKEYNIVEFLRSDAEAKADAMYAQDVAVYKAEQKAKEDAQKAREAEWKREEAEKYAKLKKTFDKEMADTKCYKEKWNRYEFGGYFQRLSKEYGITPYDVAWGDQYTKRNVSKLLQLEIMDNALKYAYHWSEAEGAVYYKDKSKQKQLFNQFIKNDYNCYLKLK